jgi:Methyltransferase domain
MFFKRLLRFFNPNQKFDYKAYWNRRYAQGGNSGDGSYGILAAYKADLINQFIKDKGIKSVIEFGCGDGSNLSLYHCESYLGMDVAASSVRLCIDKYQKDAHRSFMVYDPPHYKNNFFQADLVMSLDVLYHIIDEDDFQKSLQDIFSTAAKYVILYTILHPAKDDSIHIKRRDTLAYLKQFDHFRIARIDENPHAQLSAAQFIFLERQ